MYLAIPILLLFQVWTWAGGEGFIIPFTFFTHGPSPLGFLGRDCPCFLPGQVIAGIKKIRAGCASLHIILSIITRGKGGAFMIIRAHPSSLQWPIDPGGLGSVAVVIAVIIIHITNISMLSSVCFIFMYLDVSLMHNLELPHDGGVSGGLMWQVPSLGVS
jgi:hypothetical protein